MVPGQVDPAETAVREAAEHLVLAGDQFAGASLGANENGVAALPAEPSVRPVARPGRPTDGLAARRAEARALRDQRDRMSTAAAGSPARDGGTSTRPAPRLPDPSLPSTGTRTCSPTDGRRTRRWPGRRASRRSRPQARRRRPRGPARTRCSSRPRWLRRSPARRTRWWSRCPSALVLGGRRGRGRAAHPAPVAEGPLAAGAHLGQHGIDEPDEVRVLLGDGQAVRLVGERRANDLGEGVLGPEAGQDRVIGGDRRDVSPAAAVPGNRSSRSPRPGSGSSQFVVPS